MPTQMGTTTAAAPGTMAPPKTFAPGAGPQCSGLKPTSVKKDATAVTEMMVDTVLTTAQKTDCTKLVGADAASSSVEVSSWLTMVGNKAYANFTTSMGGLKKIGIWCKSGSAEAVVQWCDAATNKYFVSTPSLPITLTLSGDFNALSDAKKAQYMNDLPASVSSGMGVDRSAICCDTLGAGSIVYKFSVLGSPTKQSAAEMEAAFKAAAASGALDAAFAAVGVPVTGITDSSGATVALVKTTQPSPTPSGSTTTTFSMVLLVAALVQALAWL